MNVYRAYVSAGTGTARRGLEIVDIHAGKQTTAFKYAAETFLEKYPKFENQHIYICVSYISVLEKVNE